MHIFHPHEDLLHVLANLGHRYVLFLGLMLLNYLFKVSVAELKDEVLRRLSLFILRVVNVEELDHIRALAEAIKYFEFTRDIFTSLGCTLYCHRLFVRAVKSFEDITYWGVGKAMRETYRRSLNLSL
jgi:hypothetical protein